MFKVIKNKGKMVQAYKLQKDNETIKELMKEGKITYIGDGKYEIHSLETIGQSCNGVSKENVYKLL